MKYFTSVFYILLITRGGRTELRRLYCAGELCVITNFYVMFINFNIYFPVFIILYPVALLSAITCHNNIMKIRITHNICFVYKSRG